MSRLVVMPARPRQMDLLEDQHPRPVRRADGVDFRVDAFALADPDFRDQVIDDFLNLPPACRKQILRHLRQIAATPAIERLRIVDDLDELAGRRSA